MAMMRGGGMMKKKPGMKKGGMMKKKRVYDKRVRLYMLNQNWLKIRKQKDRRRRRVITKIWKAKRLAFLRNRYSNFI